MALRPTSSAWRRSRRAPSAWKVPSQEAFDAVPEQEGDPLDHLARRLVGEGDREHLVRPSSGRSASRCARRVVSTRVLPVPAPASTSSGPSARLDRRPLLGVERIEIEGVGRAAGAGMSGWLVASMSGWLVMEPLAVVRPGVRSHAEEHSRNAETPIDEPPQDAPSRARRRPHASDRTPALSMSSADAIAAGADPTAPLTGGRREARRACAPAPVPA